MAEHGGSRADQRTFSNPDFNRAPGRSIRREYGPSGELAADRGESLVTSVRRPDEPVIWLSFNVSAPFTPQPHSGSGPAAGRSYDHVKPRSDERTASCSLSDCLTGKRSTRPRATSSSSTNRPVCSAF